MRPRGTENLLALSVFLLSIFARYAAAKTFREVFTVKGGTTNGGCDNLDPKYNLDDIFKDAVDKLKTGMTAFTRYEVDSTIRNIAQSFFGVRQNAAMTGYLNWEEDEKIKEYQRGLYNMIDFVDGKTYFDGDADIRKIWFFCNSDWVVLAKQEDDYLRLDSSIEGEGRLYPSVWEDKEIGGKMVKTMRKRRQDDTGASIPVSEGLEKKFQGLEKNRKWIEGTTRAYFFKDLGLYRISDEDIPKSCLNSGSYGETSAQDGYAAITFCLRTDNLQKRAKLLDVDQGEGTYLQNLEMVSLTLIHDFLHAAWKGEETSDLAEWMPPLNTPAKNSDGKDNENWPGKPEYFVRKTMNSLAGGGGQVYAPADSVSAILLLTLKDGDQLEGTSDKINVRNNPQNYAWAIIAAVLSREGKKLDYSTGRARPLGKNPDKPANPA